jgi:hypothetical protein
LAHLTKNRAPPPRWGWRNVYVSAVSRSSKGNTFINFGGVYPRQTFTGWIPAGIPFANGSSLLSPQGKKIKISGKIELYRGKPEIKILSRNQIIEE